MAKDIIVSIKRNGVLVNTGTSVRLDNISPVVIAGSGGSVPHNSFELYSLDGVHDAQGGILIQQGDLLTDLATSEQYRLSGNPEVFDEDDHIECMVVKNVQVTP